MEGTRGMDPAQLRDIELFASLSDEQLAQLAGAGDEVAFAPGDRLFVEGEPADHWWVLVDGTLDLVRHVGAEEHRVGQMDLPGRWAGGFRAWDPDGVYLASAHGATAGRVLRVPAEALAALLREWFAFGVHLIAGLYGTAHRIEATVRARESLVTLGTLAAGLAHELNNPAAAARRAVDGLGTGARGVLAALEELAAQDIVAEQYRALDELRKELAPGTGPSEPLAAADREDELAGWLERHRVADAWELASPLAGAGADLAWCDRVAQGLDGPALQAGLEWVARTLSVTALLGEIGEATRRISYLVGAVRSTTQLARAARQPVDVTEGLDSTLVMLGHKLRGVDVVRAYDERLPRIDAYPGELNQVWTNLVDNAVDAMAGEGTLRVAARPDGDGIVVEVEDSGPGMPPQVAARAFEAFFTTKEVGSGTGLGLDIARRIVVDRHHGSIDIDSVPGRTVLRVRLPR